MDQISCCATRRFIVSPVQPGGIGGVFLWIRWLTRIRKEMGTVACQKTGDHVQTDGLMRQGIRVIWRKLDLPEPPISSDVSLAEPEPERVGTAFDEDRDTRFCGSDSRTPQAAEPDRGVRESCSEATANTRVAPRDAGYPGGPRVDAL